MTLVSPRKANKYFRAKVEFTTGPMDLDRMIKDHENLNIIDVRGIDHYALEHIPGSINLPKGTWKMHSGLSKDAETLEDAMQITETLKRVCAGDTGASTSSRSGALRQKA